MQHEDTVCSFHLHRNLNQSRVFQDAKSLAVGELKLHLTDPTTENADTIHHFLRLITSGNGLGYKYPDAWIGLEKAVNLVAFLKKWECKAALNSVAYQAHQILSDHGISRMDFFILGAVLDDPYFCSKVLKSTPQSYQSSLGGPKSWETKALVDGRGDADTADPTALPYDTWLLIPPDYYWALVRAWGESTGNKSNLAIRFLKLIQAVKSEFDARHFELTKFQVRSSMRRRDGCSLRRSHRILFPGEGYGPYLPSPP